MLVTNVIKIQKKFDFTCFILFNIWSNIEPLLQCSESDTGSQYARSVFRIKSIINTKNESACTCLAVKCPDLYSQ